MIDPDKTDAVLFEVDERKVASLTLNRPAVNNAYKACWRRWTLSAK